MESTIQIILIICVVSLTAIFVTAGVWVILILREIKNAAKKVNQIGDDVEETSQFVKKKIKDGFSMMALMATLATLWSKKENIGDLIPQTKEKLSKSQSEKVESKKDSDNPEQDSQADSQGKKKKRRFFFQKK